jgi:hypothetical protein
VCSVDKHHVRIRYRTAPAQPVDTGVTEPSEASVKTIFMLCRATVWRTSVAVSQSLPLMEEPVFSGVRYAATELGRRLTVLM